MSEDDQKHLNQQDILDLREIQKLIEIADIKAKPPMKQKKYIKVGADEKLLGQHPLNMKDIYDAKWYLDIKSDDKDGGVNVKLIMPPYNIGEIQEGYDKLYQFHISGKERAKIKKLMN